MTYADVRSIMVLGDSVFKGVVLHPEKKRYVFSKNCFIGKLKRQIRPAVFDYSKYGSTTGYGREVLKEKFSDVNPDLVLIEYGNNDCDYQWDEVAEDPYGEHLPNIGVERYAQNLRDMIRSVQGRGKIPILANLHPLGAEHYFNWFTKGDRRMREAVLVWLRSVDNIYWWHEMYSYALERTARSMGVPVIDVRGAFLRQKDYRALICEDGIHPNEGGHALMERVYLKAINRAAAELLI
jgi:lysophospholipase L1-like esterase